MRQILPCLLIFASMLAAACGGGANANGNGEEQAFIPDLSTPEGATEAFARSIETGNLSLLSLTLLDEERDEVLPIYSQKFEESRKQGLKWTIEVVDTQIVPEKEARASFKYIAKKDGKEQSTQGSFAVFQKTSDGTWKYSRAASLAWSEYQKQLREQDNAPANGEEPPTNSESGE
ncbi:MAG: hypothetical protein H6839_12985 [Planctomycetes bacterium]|nr:hypothetical protein [Planctomycetota bacterium]